MQKEEHVAQINLAKFKSAIVKTLKSTALKKNVLQLKCYYTNLIY